jgi:hypothetical protein
MKQKGCWQLQVQTLPCFRSRALSGVSIVSIVCGAIMASSAIRRQSAYVFWFLHLTAAIAHFQSKIWLFWNML